jgi:hypothetical protein
LTCFECALSLKYIEVGLEKKRFFCIQ